MKVYLTIIAIVKLWLQGIEYRFIDFRISYFVFRISFCVLFTILGILRIKIEDHLYNFIVNNYV